MKITPSSLYRVETTTEARAKVGARPFVDWFTAESVADAEAQARHEAKRNGIPDAVCTARLATQAEIDA